MATTETATETEAVADTGPLLHLDELEALDLLADFGTVQIPGAVRAELARHRQEALERLPSSCCFVSAQQTPSLLTLSVFQAFSLDAGEREALVLALAAPGSLLLTDDAAARLAAKGLGVRAYGTLGVLLRSVRRGRRSRAGLLTILRSLPKRSSLHLRRELLLRVIAEVEADSPSE